MSQYLDCELSENSSISFFLGIKWVLNNYQPVISEVNHEQLILLENVKKTCLMKNWICCMCPSNTLYPPLPSAAGPQASFDQKSCFSWEKWRKLNLHLQAASRVYCALPAGVSASTSLVFVPLDWKVKVKVLVAQLYLHLCDPMDSSLPGSSVNWILQARILESCYSPGHLPDPGIKPRSPYRRQILNQMSYDWTVWPFDQLILLGSWHILLNCFPQKKCTNTATSSAGVPVLQYSHQIWVYASGWQGGSWNERLQISEVRH